MKNNPIISPVISPDQSPLVSGFSPRALGADQEVIGMFAG